MPPRYLEQMFGPGALTPTPGAPTTLEDNLAAHIDNAAVALICGLTQVATIAGPGTGVAWAK